MLLFFTICNYYFLSILLLRFTFLKLFLERVIEHHWFLHNLFNTNPILVSFCKRIWFIQIIHRNTCHLCAKPWSITVVFRNSRGASRTKQGKFTIIENEAHHWFLHIWYCVMLVLDKGSWCSSWTSKYNSDRSMISTWTIRITMYAL